MQPVHRMMLAAALVLALAVLIAVQHQLPAILHLWTVAVMSLERILAVDRPSFSLTGVNNDHIVPIEVVVVLGYKVFGDSVPSPLLHLRLAAGAATLIELAERGPVKLVLSGGIPPDVAGRQGLPSEAEAMHAHMQRCFPTTLKHPNVSVTLEPAAHSTYTNAMNTLVQLQQQHTVPDGRQQLLSVTVATNRFHQLRSLRVFRAAGRQLGLTPDDLLLRAAPIPYSLSVAAQRQYVC